MDCSFLEFVCVGVVGVDEGLVGDTYAPTYKNAMGGGSGCHEVAAFGKGADISSDFAAEVEGFAFLTVVASKYVNFEIVIAKSMMNTISFHRGNSF